MELIKIVNFFLVVCVSYVTSSPEDEASCCPSGKGFLKRKNGINSCWEPSTNTTDVIQLGCEKTGLLVASDQYNFTVDDSGRLMILIKNREMNNDASTFCVAKQLNLNSTNLQSTRRVAVVCYVDKTKIINEKVTGYCILVSAVFLFVTAVIFTMQPELRDLLGKSIVNFCGSLSIGLAILAAMNLIPYSDMNLCAARGFFAYFFLMTSFFWMNAISIQILLNIRGQSTSHGGRFTWYAIYAWGCPAVLTIAMAIVNFMPGDHLKPGIGLNHCWFFDDRQQWWYMYSVISVLVTINIGIFIYTSFLLWHLSFSSHSKTLRYKFLMTIRLFVVMGVPWIFEMIGTMAPRNLAWEVLDLINTLQGVWIFLVLVVFPSRPSKEDTDQYNLNITIEQPYNKLVL